MIKNEKKNNWVDLILYDAYKNPINTVCTKDNVKITDGTRQKKLSLAYSRFKVYSITNVISQSAKKRKLTSPTRNKQGGVLKIEKESFTTYNKMCCIVKTNKFKPLIYY